jgi:hypothetical protein
MYRAIKCGPPLGGPLVSNHAVIVDAVMIRLMRHHWHSAPGSPVAGGRLALRVSEALVAPSVSY